jgi:hypothetical protein
MDVWPPCSHARDASAPAWPSSMLRTPHSGAPPRPPSAAMAAAQRLFGGSLERIVEKQAQHMGSPCRDELGAPLVLVQTLASLRALGAATTPGIFCRPAAPPRVAALRQQFEGGDLRQGGEEGPEVWATLLKEFLSELSEPLVPASSYEACVVVPAALIDGGDAEGGLRGQSVAAMDRLRALVSAFPAAQERALCHLMDFLRTVRPFSVGFTLRLVVLTPRTWRRCARLRAASAAGSSR